MRILVISRWFSPSKNPRAFRTTELVREFLIRGHTVDFFAPHNAVFDDSFLKSNGQYYGVISRENKQVENTDIQYGLLNILKGKCISSLKKLVRFFLGEGIRDIGYAFRLFRALRLNITHKKYDMVLAISYPFSVLVAVALYLRSYKDEVLKVADCGDPFYDNPAFKKAGYLKYLERWVLRCFDKIVIPMEEAIPSYRYCDIRDRICIIPQGFRLLEIQNNIYLPCEIPTFCYAGVFYETIRDPRFFLEYLCREDLNFKFVVYALEDPFTKHILRIYKKRMGEKLVIKKPVEREQLILEMAKMDFVLNFDNENVNQKPSKLIDYAMSRRPILSFNRQTFCPDVFQAFLRGDYTAQYHVDLEKYDIRRVTDQFESLFTEHMKREGV